MEQSLNRLYPKSKQFTRNFLSTGGSPKAGEKGKANKQKVAEVMCSATFLIILHCKNR